VALVAERAAPRRALVVDDEPLARRNVTVLLRGDPDIESIEECGFGVEAIEVIRRWKHHSRERRRAITKDRHLSPVKVGSSVCPFFCSLLVCRLEKTNLVGMRLLE
jgi:hypothetical protein